MEEYDNRIESVEKQKKREEKKFREKDKKR